jgi:hypothetical protein
VGFFVSVHDVLSSSTPLNKKTMNKKYFALKLNPCRPDFAQTMSDEERSIMQQGKVVVFVLFLTLVLFMDLGYLP